MSGAERSGRGEEDADPAATTPPAATTAAMVRCHGLLARIAGSCVACSLMCDWLSATTDGGCAGYTAAG